MLNLVVPQSYLVLTCLTAVLATPTGGMIPTNENLVLGGKPPSQTLLRTARIIDQKIEIFVSLGEFEVES
jgi:hypothetical protein